MSGSHDTLSHLFDYYYDSVSFGERNSDGLV